MSFSIKYCYFAMLGMEILFAQLRLFFFIWKNLQSLSSMYSLFLLTRGWVITTCSVLLVNNGIMEQSVGVSPLLLLFLTIPIIPDFKLLLRATASPLCQTCKLSKQDLLPSKIIHKTMIKDLFFGQKIIYFITFVLTRPYKLCCPLCKLTSAVPVTRDKQELVK